MSFKHIQPELKAAEQVIDLDEHGLYINCELSWLQFNVGVLEEALDQRYPLLERRTSEVSRDFCK